MRRCRSLLIFIFFLLVILSGCGSGGGSGASAGTGTLLIDMPSGKSYSPAAYYEVVIADPVTLQPVVPSVRIIPPNTSVTIENVPLGNKLVKIEQFDENNNQIGYGSSVVNVIAGNNPKVTITVNNENAYWLIVHPVRSQWLTAQTPVEELDVAMNMVSMNRWSGSLSVQTPDGARYSMGDLGPGGSIYVQNYSYGYPPSSQTGAVLGGRGTGSYFEARASLSSASVPGDYTFQDNTGTLSKVVTSDAGYPQAPQISSPSSQSEPPLDSDIAVTWQPLGGSYKYLCEAYRLQESSSGNPIYTHYWSSVDTRDMNFACPNLLNKFISSLSSNTGATIPANTFPDGTEDIIIAVWAFPADQINIDPYSRTVDPYAQVGRAVIPTGMQAIILYPSAAKDPLVESVSPGSGRPLTVVTVSGDYFGYSHTGNSLSFNGTEVTAANVISWNYQQIICRVPVGAATGPVVVTTSTGPSNTDVIFTVDETPYIFSVNPPCGPVLSTVTINGVNFGPTQGASVVSFNGVDASLASSWSDTSIICQVPASASPGPVVVTTTQGTSNDDVIFGVTPAITSIGPDSGYIGSNTTITGSNFGASQGDGVLMFNGGAYAIITYWNDCLITCQVPDGAISGPVVVITQYGQSNNDKTYTVIPHILNVSPGSGPADTNVTVTGTAFGFARGTSTVSFNGVNAASYLSWTDTCVMCAVPPSASTGPVVLTTNDGSSNNDKTFTVTGPPEFPPSVGNISPSSGPAGTIVTIYGLNFGNSQDTVEFNGIAAAINSWVDNQIVCVAPDGGSTGPVTVTVDGIRSNEDKDFIYEEP
ncbi:MAG: IPT/TIG domain-containing protein [Chloroflexi bacterium]|nr:IPT/TIG domain-containing protein [Chloroflexota bacterium]